MLGSMNGKHEGVSVKYVSLIDDYAKDGGPGEV